jgi:acyl-CoA synthetase (AMP-forming)/AMP-acid ligase II
VSRPHAPDRIALLCGNSDAFVAVRDAVTVAGQVLVPINPRLAPPEIAYILDNARPAVIYAEPALAHLLPDDAMWRDANELRPPRAPNPDEFGATLLFTSGTTGRPKGCLRTAEQEAARARELIASYSISADDVHLIACPLAHSAPGIFLRAGRSVGARTVILPRFRAEDFLAAVERERATLFFLVPTQYKRILALPESVRAGYDVSSVRAAIVAGAPIAIESKRRIVDWLGDDKLWEFYGSSETGTVAVLPPELQLSKPGSVGRPPPGVEVRLVDGEIFVRSPTVMSGYLDDPTDSPGGFLSVGDIGRFDDDGCLYLIDRKHDTIISGGVNVYPAEVERALEAHERVTGAVAFGEPDPEWGQIVTAMVAGDATVTELRAFLRERVAAFKIPKRFIFVGEDELPIGASGKPLRRRARQLAAESNRGPC